MLSPKAATDPPILKTDNIRTHTTKSAATAGIDEYLRNFLRLLKITLKVFLDPRGGVILML